MERQVAMFPASPVSAAEHATPGGTADRWLALRKYDIQEAARQDADTNRYEQRAKEIDPRMDPKDHRREGLQITGESNRAIAIDVRSHAVIHPLEVEPAGMMGEA